MVRLTIAFNGASARNVEELLEALRFLETATRPERGCRECSVWSQRDLSVHYVEEWETEADMRRRVRSSSFTTLLGVIESARDLPRVEFDFVTRTRGIDYIAEIRSDSITGGTPPAGTG